MLMTITYTGRDTADLGYLLYKNPSRPQVVELNHGRAYVFYPEVSEARTTAALLLEIDPIDLARGPAGNRGGGLFDYVNDRPYVSSSFLSTAIAKVFGTAMSGRCDQRPELADTALDLSATITMLPCRGEQAKLGAVFEPLGYVASYTSFTADDAFPDWGPSRYVNLTLSGHVRLRDLLRQVYVLIPVFDQWKHYWMSHDEVDKLLQHSQDWLPDHPEKAYITARYLGRHRHLVDQAFERLAAVAEADGEVLPEVGDEAADAADASAELPEVPGVPDGPGQPTVRPPRLNDQRLDAVMAALESCGAASVIDLGCGEGHLLARLVRQPRLSRIAGMDVSVAALKRARDRLHLDQANQRLAERVSLFQGSLTYKDARLAGYDAACVVEVIEHLDPARLSAFERVLFAQARPKTVILTTPNHEYNVIYALPDDQYRHRDHRFEWPRAEFEVWATRVGQAFGYAVRLSGIGQADERSGAPTQMAVFTRAEMAPA